ncbi:MAG: cation transporter [Betaproteobacteria bacterium]|nr:MAG: cation transporter [Betaproteobacteria bacterium]
MPATAYPPSPRRRKASPPREAAARSRDIQRVAIVALTINALLTVGQIVIGLFAGAFSLVADAAHTLSDLVTDALVLVAGRHSGNPADQRHPYGHARIETVTSLLLGLVLGGVGLGFLWSSGLRLQHMGQLPSLHPAALVMAVVTLAAKEGMFRYILASARRLQAPMLETNAWHARSDAASSLVVAAGIGGSLAGYPFLEPLAAAIVGFLILHMGFRFALRAVRELIDTGLPEEELARLRRTILDTPGVVNLHDLRTRRMANRVLCDAHVQVEPRLTVSEGHRVSDSVYARVRVAHPEVQDVLVHIDPEDDADLQMVPPGPPPERAEVLTTVGALLGPGAPKPRRVQIHYLGDRIDVEVLLPGTMPTEQLNALNRRTAEWLGAHPSYRSMSFFVHIAP